MSAVLAPFAPLARARAAAPLLEARLEPMTPERLDAVLAIEQGVYSHPWTRGNFCDSLAGGHRALCLVAAPQGPGPAAGGEQVMGYFVALPGYREMHLLNITVAPAFQRQGWALVLLDALELAARAQRAEWLWLEVRVGNARAQQLYLRRGFARVGLRKGYYPAGHGEREDAVVMSLRLAEGA